MIIKYCVAIAKVPNPSALHSNLRIVPFHNLIAIRHRNELQRDLEAALSTMASLVPIPAPQPDCPAHPLELQEAHRPPISSPERHIATDKGLLLNPPCEAY